MSLDNILLIPGLGGASYHPDVVDWQIRIAAEGGTASSATLAALSTFAESIEAAGLRSKLWRLNVFCGSNLNAALTPFYNSPTTGGSAEGFVIDQNNGPFVTADWSESTGLTGDRSAKILNTGLAPADIDANLGGMSLHVLEKSASSTEIFMQARQTGVTSCNISRGSSDQMPTFWGGVSTEATYTPGVFVTISRTLTNLQSSYNNGVFANSTTVATAGASAVAMPVFGSNVDGVLTALSDARLGGYVIHEALDAIDVANLYAAWSALSTALGR